MKNLINEKINPLFGRAILSLLIDIINILEKNNRFGLLKSSKIYNIIYSKRLKKGNYKFKNGLVLVNPTEKQLIGKNVFSLIIDKKISIKLFKKISDRISSRFNKKGIIIYIYKNAKEKK